MIYKESIVLHRKEGSFQVGFCIMKNAQPNISDYKHVLHDDEIDYYSNLEYEKRKISYLQGRVVAKYAISEVIENFQSLKSILIKSGVFHFPVVKNILKDNIQISISHSDEYGFACAFQEEHPIGVDIERINKENSDAIAKYISEDEHKQIVSCSLEKHMGDTLIWTSKESLSKILKTGLTIDFRLLDICSIVEKDKCYICHFKNFLQYKSISRCIDGYMYSIVIPSKTSSILIIKLLGNIKKHLEEVKDCQKSLLS
ncbi:4'-phosphopantetheinyl transferase family protein [Aquimarina algicola]|uniref:Enterobactin synthase component D n=1 Tax=Aquimarina algicola TaxID=2589995 RepID=A0A504JLP7_9FLAO|nr:4'-phosphopantetheinyl transferase superfamily protein [Aquimarina algicola]TPN89315.1 4'-phosphopantetheinyl transferase superfamily protein [Aquimarina algicola]